MYVLDISPASLGPLTAGTLGGAGTGETKWLEAVDAACLPRFLSKESFYSRINLGGVKPGLENFEHSFTSM